MDRVRLRSWTAIGGRVATARERAGYTQRELAERVGLYRSALTRVELGQRQLDALELARLADTLGRSVEWFLTEPPTAIASHREGLATNPDVQRLEDELERLARDVGLLAEVDGLAAPARSLPSGVTTLEEAETGAQAARSLLGREDGPVTDLPVAVEPLGLLAFSLDLGPSVIDGGYVRSGELGVALVNGAADAGRRRFNLAHELGHHLLADEYTADFGLGTSRADREALIDAFAIHFLLPRSSVRRRWAELGREHGDPRTRLVILAAEYRVSWSAMVSHAVTVGLIPRADLDLLNARRPTTVDYLELGIGFIEELESITLAPAYSRAAVRAYRRGVISADRAVELLRGTVTLDDLPGPDEVPIQALVREFEDLG